MSKKIRLSSFQQNSNKGFTVLEVLIVSLLVAVILTVVSQVIADYSKSIRYIQEKEKAMFSINMGIHCIADELREANEVLSVSQADPENNRIIFKRRKPPAAASDYQTLTTQPDYGMYLKNPKSETPAQTVEYYTSNNTLYRRIDDQDESELLKNINSLSITYKNNGIYDISLTIIENAGKSTEKLHNLSTTVQVRGKI